MRRQDEIDDPRRQLLIQALGAGLLGLSVPAANAITFGIFGSRPKKLPDGQSIYGLSGQVTVNDKEANLSTPIKAGDTVQTAQNSEIVFVVNTHSMILRGDSKLIIEKPAAAPPESLLIGGLRMLSGKLLSVSRNSQMQISSSTATIGIRGTGFYIEADPERTYFCACYGATEVQATADPTSQESIAAKHHDRPIYIVTDGGSGKNIRIAPFVNHTDQELALIETLVGRKTPFVFSNDVYTGPRRSY